jgi:hypothetical protein
VLLLGIDRVFFIGTGKQQVRRLELGQWREKLPVSGGSVADIGRGDGSAVSRFLRMCSGMLGDTGNGRLASVSVG